MAQKKDRKTPELAFNYAEWVEILRSVDERCMLCNYYANEGAIAESWSASTRKIREDILEFLSLYRITMGGLKPSKSDITLHDGVYRLKG